MRHQASPQDHRDLIQLGLFYRAMATKAPCDPAVTQDSPLCCVVLLVSQPCHSVFLRAGVEFVLCGCVGMFMWYPNSVLDSDVTESCLERACWGVTGAGVDTPVAERRYEEVTDLGQLQHTITAYIQDYNSCHSTPLNLVTFKHMVAQVSRISRVLSRAGGHLLLVGAGGSGRRSLTRLASHICGHTLLLPRITPDDDYREVKEAVKEAVMRAGVDEFATVVVVGDAALHHPDVLHLINTLILTGNAPNILSPEDKCYLKEVINCKHHRGQRLRLYMEGQEMTDSEVWEEQERRVKDLVHIVVTCLPSPGLHHTLTHYPAFTTRVTINFFKRWPEEALVRVGEHYLEEVPLRRSMRDTVITAATLLHQLARATLTPFSMCCVQID
ncbi:Dynein heavy chain 1, axonemal [Portunus trituberculatus]|uniref:Dynein heavy chain 1, axonemal n=1 Tax=Portunus trituberculatus TaxID=210409 RepID=A0A5B7CPR0_PORTR|nr:Dynein heavy chain 1, axonemal [Portunus trituberculatus]